MGSPQTPSAEQYAELEKAGQLQMLGSPRWVNIKDGVSTTQFNLQRQGVSLIKMTW
jgi:xylan 1,4-beta-xylosidase